MLQSLDQFPNEILHQIFIYISPQTIPAVQLVSRQFNDLCQPILWRHFCRSLFKYWSPQHRIREKFASNVSKVRWKSLFAARHQIDRAIGNYVNEILSQQVNRIARIECITSYGYDAKDTLLRHLQASDAMEDVLARRFFSGAVLGTLHRAIAIKEWVELAQGTTDIPLDRGLAGFDMFILHDRQGDLEEVSVRLDNLASMICIPENARTSTRCKAIAISRFLVDQNFVGIRTNVSANYHNMQNNFIGIALEDPEHPSLPLVSVAIYCCIAKRLGVDARPCGFPFHMLAIIQPPSGFTLDGQAEDASEAMYIDPFRSYHEISVQDLSSQLTSMGVLEEDRRGYLDASPTIEILRRAAKNIITSVQTQSRDDGNRNVNEHSSFLDVDGAFYSALWALMLLAGGNPTTVNVQRIQVLPHLIQRLKDDYCADVGLVENYLLPLFEDPGVRQMIIASIQDIRRKDQSLKQAKPRVSQGTHAVRYRIGQHFEHRRYGYSAFIIGWDTDCQMDDAWQAQMRVNDLSRGKYQSFYHVQWVTSHLRRLSANTRKG